MKSSSWSRWTCSTRTWRWSSYRGVKKIIFHNVHVLTPIFQAKYNENNFKVGGSQPHGAGEHVQQGAGGHVQQGHGGGHHLGGEKNNVSQCTCSNPNFSRR